MFSYRAERGQAITELAIFGSIILIIFGVLLSYLQRLNDQQYVQMEAFRRGLQKACTYIGNSSDGAGASVQYTLVQDRRHADLSGGLGKGGSTTLSSSANVFWAVPKASGESDNLIVFKINEDELVRNYREFVPKEHDQDWSFRTEEMNSTSQLKYEDTMEKRETSEGITNIKTSQLQETKKVIIPYTVRVKDNDDNDDNDAIAKPGGTFWEGTAYPKGELTQHIYRDTDGQYKYSSKVADNTAVVRTRTWTTGF